MPDPSPWPLLMDVRQFSIRVRTGSASGVRTTQSGVGHLQVELADSPDRAGVNWREEGRWTSGPLAGIAFRNASAWRLYPGGPAIELSHLRRGPDVPTFLVRLQPARPGLFLTETPHACGRDSYSASLRWDRDRLELCWDVRSPVDPYRLRLTAWRGRSDPRAG